VPPFFFEGELMAIVAICDNAVLVFHCSFFSPLPFTISISFAAAVLFLGGPSFDNKPT
jgi:hypothetical protein